MRCTGMRGFACLVWIAALSRAALLSGQVFPAPGAAYNPPPPTAYAGAFAPSQSPTPLPALSAAEPERAAACQSCAPCQISGACDACPTQGLTIFVGYDSWRGIADGGWDNNGVNTGLNFGTRLGKLSDWTGIGFQMGGSAGAYDWSGTDYRLARQSDAQAQGFVTYGFFRNPNEQSKWGGAVVQDWMIADNYSVFAEQVTLSQWRAQLSYAVTATQEFGLSGTWRAVSDTRTVNGFGAVTWRPIDQLSFFWHYKWGEGAPDTWLSFGVPEHDRLAGGGSLGDYLVSVFANCPLNDRVGLYALVTYMHPSASPGPAGSNEDVWNFTIGLAFYPRENARSTTVAGQCWMPRLPVANNGTFLVDASQTF